MPLRASSTTPLLLHNPRCSKSRALKAALDERGIAHEERRYLDEPLDRAELRELAKCVEGGAAALVRWKEPEARASGLTREDAEAKLLALLVEQPKLLERPVLVTAKRAAIGRPGPEDALGIL